MKKYKKEMYVKLLIAISMLFTVSVSHSSQGMYFGFNVGLVDYDLALDSFAVLDDGLLTTSSLDDSSISLSWNVGYQFTKNLSLEGGYIIFDEITFNAVSDGSGSYAPGPVTGIVNTDGLFFALKAQVPLSKQFGLYGKFGFWEWDSNITLSDSVNEGRETLSGNDAFSTIGGSYILGLSEDYSVVLNFDYTFYEVEDLDVDVLSVGIQVGY
jgi:hypothetical protein